MRLGDIYNELKIGQAATLDTLMIGLYGLLANTLQNFSESMLMERFGGILQVTTDCSKTAFPKRL